MFALRRRATPDLPGPAVPKSALLSFPGGLQELVAALSSALGNRLRTDTLVQSIARSPEGWLVNVRGSEPLEATDLVLAVPARIAGELLAPCGSPSLSFETLDRVRHADVTLVHLGLARADVPGLPRGFGFLVPPSESATDPSRARDPASGGSLRMLGTIFASNLFPGRAQEGFAAVSSFHASRDLEGLDDPGRVAVACEDLARALGLAHPPRPRVGVVQRGREIHAGDLHGMVGQPVRVMAEAAARHQHAAAKGCRMPRDHFVQHRGRPALFPGRFTSFVAVVPVSHRGCFNPASPRFKRITQLI
jgi:oxygen-dependent protoporphyrinogen oxidase